MYTWNPVSSSQISAMAYKDNLMLIRFASGVVYTYQNVSPEMFSAILTSDSVGKAFNRLIKANPFEYPFTQLRDVPRAGGPVEGLTENNHPLG